MKLYVKQTSTPLKEEFSVINSKEENRYFVEGESVSFGRKLHIYDNDKKEAACIRQKFLSIQPRFHVFQGGKIVMEVSQKFTLIKHKYEIDGSGWTISGDLESHDYTIACSYGKVVGVSVSEFAGGEFLTLDLSNTVNEVMIVRALATVLAINCVAAKKISGQRKKKK